MQARLVANLPAAHSGAATGFGGGTLPPQVQEGFAKAMQQSLLLPAAAILIGLVAVCFLHRPTFLDAKPAAHHEPQPASTH